MIIYFPPPRWADPGTYPAAGHPSRTHIGLVPNVELRVNWVCVHIFIGQLECASAWVHKKAIDNFFEPNTVCIFLWFRNELFRWQIILPVSCNLNRWLCRFFKSMRSMSRMPRASRIQTLLLRHLVKAYVFVTTSIICQEVRQIIRMGTDFFNYNTCIIEIHQSCRSIVWVL